MTFALALNHGMWFSSVQRDKVSLYIGKLLICLESDCSGSYRTILHSKY